MLYGKKGSFWGCPIEMYERFNGKSVMTFRSILKFSLIGFAIQALLFVLVILLPLPVRKLWANLYFPWTELGGILDRSSGAGGHAFQGGVILAFLLGVLVYSLLIGAAICYFYERK